ncbi:BspA family leucine-rich repeat surface protein, partial [Enterococcus faecalis]
MTDKVIKLKTIRKFSSLFMCNLLILSIIIPTNDVLADTQTSSESLQKKIAPLTVISNTNYDENPTSIPESSASIGSNMNESNDRSTQESVTTSKEDTTISSTAPSTIVDSSTKTTAGTEQTGTWGTCPISLDDNGVLTIGTGTAGIQPTHRYDSVFSGTKIYKSSVKSIKIIGTVVAPENSENLFANMTDCSSIEGLENLNTSNAINMSNMFFNCTSLISIDTSNFDTSKVTNMSGMFETSIMPGLSSLRFLDVSNLDTSNVTDMSKMFLDCNSLTYLNLSNFDTSKVTNMSSMFYGCNSLNKLTLGKYVKTIAGTELPEPSNDNIGKSWQNIGTGSEDNPEGAHSWTSAQFTANYHGDTDADTYVLFEKKAQPLTINYVDQEGKPIADVSPVTITGFIGDKVDLKKYEIAIKGYAFVSADKEVSEL